MKARWLVALLALALVAPAALAQEKQEKKGLPGAVERAKAEKEKKENDGKKLPEAELVFTEKDKGIIKDWFRTRRSGLPPGLAKRDRLPPGLEMQLRTRGKLPPGLQKRVQPLPIELDRRLHRLPTGYRRVVLGGNVILMEEKTAVIYDILRDVIR